ncbi:site-specific integrase [Devosia sp.]|uniref:tyrosine-type recombinase/integrase n=1 Tax=Devosia sp. TaxID=1871048 RepID=UPI002AFE5EDC|nr:site-specific integrase [Devosia sp.]
MPLKLKKRGEIWWYSGTVAGKRLRGSTKTAQKTEAQRIANALESRWLEGGRDPGVILTFAQAAGVYREHRANEPRYLEMVEDYWKDTLVRDITKGALKRAALTLMPNASGATRNRSVIVPTSAVINHCADLDMCPPFKAARFPEVKTTKEPATWEWIRAFMKHASPHLGALACFMFLTGARIGEAIRVSWGDVDLSAAKVRIVMGKLGGEERIAHMPPELVVALANIPTNRNPDDQVFAYSMSSAVTQTWNAVIKRAQIKKVTPHGCRHGFATALMHAGIDPVTVAKRGGWKSPAQLFATYGHAMDDEMVTNVLTGTPAAQRHKARRKHMI